MSLSSPAHWLDWYGGSRYDWQCINDHRDATYFARRLGLVESFFDHDGVAFGGRADLANLLELEIHSTLSEAAFKDHVLKSWAALRAAHPLLRATAVDAENHEVLRDKSLSGRCFLIKQLQDASALLDEAKQSIVFLSDHGYRNVDPQMFYRHCMNTARCFDASEALSKLFVLPLQKLTNDRYVMRTVTILAHQITDGLTTHAWQSHFVDLLNLSDAELQDSTRNMCTTTAFTARLPPAQEAVYPPVGTSTARTRWNWAISRVLRHKRVAPPAAFKNPLKRADTLPEASAMPPTFAKVLDYSRKPPCNGYVGAATLSAPVTKNIVRLCREVKCSVGSGLFTLVGMAQMALEEFNNPDISLEQRRPFVASFPLNPRPFLNHKGPPDSIMLAFSDGISLPFLPATLPVEARFKLLVRQAHRQLGVYQKKPRSGGDAAKLGARSPSQMIPMQYLMQVERINDRGTPHASDRLIVQGDYPAAQSQTGATNGVSSVGDRSGIICAGRHKLDGSKSFQADFRDLIPAVRAREGEFLCACYGDLDSLKFNVAYDGNSVDETKFDLWKEKMETMLMPQTDAKL